ncbi:MAG TPA: hypothetical protein VI194_12955, partial [Mycobacterium sp.]
MTGYGPPDDPSEAPTGYIDYGDDGQQQPEPETPWYRNRVLLALWATMVALLIVLIIYGLLQLS